VLDGARGQWRAELLTHNPKNAVTRGVWRVRSGERSAVLKIVCGTRRTSDAKWTASREPAHWNYWRREAEFYASDLRQTLGDAGLGSPHLLASIERSADEIALWLEDVQGTRGDAWTLADHVAAAAALGRAQATVADGDSRGLAWLSRGFLRAYSNKPVDFTLLEDDAVWELPLVAECFGPATREAGRRLLAEREWLLGWMERLPRSVCHLDFWPMNLLRRQDGSLVALDWAFVGDGAIGEDLGNCVPDASFDLFVAPEELPELDRATFSAYCAGLAESGATLDADVVRMGVCASAVKYSWLLPLLLERAVAGEHAAYGGEALADPREQLRRRGKTLCFLSGWIDEAQRLAPRVEKQLAG